MSTIATTRMSSKGQVVIPETIREKLGLKPGTQFVVLADDGVVILKEITPPSMAQFDDLIADARRTAHQAGLRKSDIRAAISEVRGKR